MRVSYLMKYIKSSTRTLLTIIFAIFTIIINNLKDQKASYDFNDMDADPRPRDTDPDNW